jgi:hypothetical protein
MDYSAVFLDDLGLRSHSAEHHYVRISAAFILLGQ